MQKMISRILEQQHAIHQVLHDDRKYRHLVSTWQDIDVLESLNAPSDFTDMLSDHINHPTCDSSYTKEKGAEHWG